MEHNSIDDDRWWERGRAKWNYVLQKLKAARPGKHSNCVKAKLRGLARR